MEDHKMEQQLKTYNKMNVPFRHFPLFRDWDNKFFPVTGPVKTRGFVPSLNILESDESFFIQLSIPGYTREDLKIELDNQQLAISSQGPANGQERKFLRKEFEFGAFKRIFALPDSIDAENIRASFKNGILEVVLGKKEEAKPKPARIIEVG